MEAQPVRRNVESYQEKTGSTKEKVGNCAAKNKKESMKKEKTTKACEAN